MSEFEIVERAVVPGLSRAELYGRPVRVLAALLDHPEKAVKVTSNSANAARGVQRRVEELAAKERRKVGARRTGTDVFFWLEEPVDREETRR